MFKAAVFCLASNAEQIDRIATRLRQAGFRRHDISVLFPTRALSDRSRRAAVGGLAWLAETEPLAISGIGLLIASGPIMAAMAGAAVLGSPTGGINHVLATLGMSAEQISQYEQHLRQGQVLLCLRTDGGAEAAVAMQIFVQEGARNIVDIEDEYRGYTSAA